MASARIAELPVIAATMNFDAAMPKLAASAPYTATGLSRFLRGMRHRRSACIRCALSRLAALHSLAVVTELVRKREEVRVVRSQRLREVGLERRVRRGEEQEQLQYGVHLLAWCGL